MRLLKQQLLPTTKAWRGVNHNYLGECYARIKELEEQDHRQRRKRFDKNGL